MQVVYERPKTLTDLPFIYCPGCHHGIIHRLVAEAINELDIQDRTTGVTTSGCTVRSWRFFNVDICQAAHGRALAAATGIKRCIPDSIVFTYQGDGDMAAIGMAETMHAAARGENITVIFANNAVFGATGGQLAPTTLAGQRTSTTQAGRDVGETGYPMRMLELLSGLEATTYLARAAVNSPRNVRQAKQMVQEAFATQVRGEGFAMVEILSACPTNLRMTPVESLRWVEEQMIPYYPLGVVKSPGEGS